MLSELQVPLNLTWRRGQDMPFEMNYHPGAIVIKGKVYVGGGSTDFKKSTTVMVYNIQRDDWSMLPQYPYKWFTLGAINGQLVLVGGTDDAYRRTNEIGVWNELTKKWTNPFPEMPTRCSGAAVAAHMSNDIWWLVIAGGYNEESVTHSNVNILDTSTKQWYCGLPLPTPLSKLSSVVISNRWYLVGGYDHLSMTTVLCVSLDDLIFRSILRHARSEIKSLATSDCDLDAPWKVLCDSPSERCIVLALRGALLAVCGATVFLYKSSTKEWVKVGEMLSNRRECVSAVLPSGELFVVGGYTHHVDICTL